MNGTLVTRHGYPHQILPFSHCADFARWKICVGKNWENSFSVKIQIRIILNGLFQFLSTQTFIGQKRSVWGRHHTKPATLIACKPLSTTQKRLKITYRFDMMHDENPASCRFFMQSWTVFCLFLSHWPGAIRVLVLVNMACSSLYKSTKFTSADPKCSWWRSSGELNVYEKHYNLLAW